MTNIKHISLFLVVLAVVGLAAVFWDHRGEGRSEIPNAAAEKGDYRVVFLGGSPSIKLAFEGFKWKLDELAKENDVNVEYINLDVPFSPVNIANAADYIASADASLIVTGQSEIPYLLRKITTIPIMCVLSSDPVGIGLAASEEGSGNNVVFLDSGNQANTGRRLEFFLEAVPNARNILVLRGDLSVSSESEIGFATLSEAAKRHGVTLIDKRFASRDEMNKFILNFDFSTVDAIFRYPGTFVSSNADLIFAFKERIKKPIIVINQEELAQGGFIAYGPRYEEFGRVGAAMAWQILKGQVTPAEAPILRPFRNMLGVNKSVAAALGITLPASLLEKADYIIE